MKNGTVKITISDKWKTYYQVNTEKNTQKNVKML